MNKINKRLGHKNTVSILERDKNTANSNVYIEHAVLQFLSCNLSMNNFKLNNSIK